MDYCMKIVRKLVQRLRLESLFRKDTATMEAVKCLYRRQDAGTVFREIWYRRILVMLALLLLTVVAVVVCFVRDTSQEVVKNGRYIEREDAGKTVSFGVEAQTEEGTLQKEFTLRLERRKFSDGECQKIEDQADAYIENALRGENGSLKHVSKPLNFVASVPGTGVRVDWEAESRYVDEDGTIRYHALPREGCSTVVRASAKWNNWEKEYSFPVFLEAAHLSPKEELLSEIQASVETAVSSQGTNRRITLPGQVAGSDVKYVNLEGEKDFSMVYVVSGLLFLMPVLWWRKQKEALMKRDEELLYDYPELVNKVMLLLCAGMTVRGCFERIGKEYAGRLREGGKLRYVYEEVNYACQEMENGMPESEAVEAFGKRCGQLCYFRFSSLLSQNIRKGSEGMLKLLETESMDAFEQRKEAVKQRGEKAGTKLLLPMVLMLGIVIAIIIIPAFMTM